MAAAYGSRLPSCPQPTAVLVVTGLTSQRPVLDRCGHEAVERRVRLASAALDLRPQQPCGC